MKTSTIRGKKDAEWRGKNDKFVLQYYTAPRDGGHREVLTVQALEHRIPDAWIKLHNRFGAKAHFKRWFFETIDELMDFDRWLWKTRYLDKVVSEQEKLLGIRFE